MSDSTVSVIVPVRNEAGNLAATLAMLRDALQAGDELVVVDGGSTDGSVEIARELADRVVLSAPGRARQMNAGARQASGDWLWFVHADSQLDGSHRQQLTRLPTDARWGRFDVRLSGQRFLFRVIGAMINLRSRFSGIATGDQGIFVRRDIFTALEGYPDQPLMEDIALSRRLKQQQGRPCCLRPALTTSSRRWEVKGAWPTIWLMWSLRYRYWRGVQPEELYRDYYGEH
ncbi:MAG: TIGR04283 family arsenosugar biosynthesis glycosyltransferase [Alcanivorax sp.]|uniref:TIGR04283 family arsenosugar biosynthesis glycosyltransferase n=1 Tax=Alcanivorax sp. TaxID=1872427 RepID=UPI003DA717C4